MQSLVLHVEVLMLNRANDPVFPEVIWRRLPKLCSLVAPPHLLPFVGKCCSCEIGPLHLDIMEMNAPESPVQTFDTYLEESFL